MLLDCMRSLDVGLFLKNGASQALHCPCCCPVPLGTHDVPTIVILIESPWGRQIISRSGLDGVLSLVSIAVLVPPGNLAGVIRVLCVYRHVGYFRSTEFCFYRSKNRVLDCLLVSLLVSLLSISQLGGRICPQRMQLGGRICPQRIGPPICLLCAYPQPFRPPLGKCSRFGIAHKAVEATIDAQVRFLGFHES